MVKPPVGLSRVILVVKVVAMVHMQHIRTQFIETTAAAEPGHQT